MKNEKKNKICKTKKRPEPEGSWPLKNRKTSILLPLKVETGLLNGCITTLPYVCAYYLLY